MRTQNPDSCYEWQIEKHLLATKCECEEFHKYMGLHASISTNKFDHATLPAVTFRNDAINLLISSHRSFTLPVPINEI